MRGVFASLLHFEQNKINAFKVNFLTLSVSATIKKNKFVGSIWLLEPQFSSLTL